MIATRQRVWLALGLLALPAAAFVPGGTVGVPHVQTRPVVSGKPDGQKFSSPAGQRPFPEAQTPMNKGLSDGHWHWGLVYPRSGAGAVVERWMDYARTEVEASLEDTWTQKWQDWNDTAYYLEQMDYDIEQGKPDYVFALSTGLTEEDKPSIRVIATVILAEFLTIAPAPGKKGVMIRKLAVKPAIEDLEEMEALEAQMIRQICDWSQDIGRFVAIELIDIGVRGHYQKMGFRNARYKSFMIHEGADSEVDVPPEIRALNFLTIAEPFHDKLLLAPLQDLGFISKPPADYPRKEKQKLPWQVQGMARTLELLGIGGNDRSAQ